ncbi:MAG: secondary thiamine-phosphate synthase enzyme YjbQ [Deltaproteobacteria bacterium]|nr:secondary thiamine-phosphate synthase enzyme YjbQ [Deltaproteobacteria bacterium]
MDVKKFSIKTNKRFELVDITSRVLQIVSRSEVEEGVVVVFCRHTTAGITINENADPAVQSDMLWKLKSLIPPAESEYQHAEGNSDSHLKSSIVGVSETIIIDEGRLLLGTWQGIYFAEFDGPRSREVLVKVIAG